MLDPRIERIIKRYAEQIRTEFEIEELILFGSYAGGTATAESDVASLSSLRMKFSHVLKS